MRSDVTGSYVSEREILLYAVFVCYQQGSTSKHLK